MTQTKVVVVQKETIAPAWWRLTLSAAEAAAQLLPGQLLLLRCADSFTCYLRRPIFPISEDNNRLDLLVRPDPDPGLAWLAARQPGDCLDIIGPLGHGFPLDNLTRNLLLVGDTPAIGPLLGQMKRAIAAGVSVTLALGAQRADNLYPLSLLPPEVEVQQATLDGSAGWRGPVTDLLPDLLGWADAVCACGSTALYRGLKRQTAQVRLAPPAGLVYGLAPVGLIACGVGACLGCNLETSIGPRLTCVDGPVFDLMTLDL
ncbi:MAG: hypothetical protein AB1801_18065 [Chloroflexota bacterium]